MDSDKRFFMVVQITGYWRKTVTLVCRLRASELPWEAGWHVDEIWLEFPCCRWLGVRAYHYLPSQKRCFSSISCAWWENLSVVGLKWNHLYLVLNPVPWPFYYCLLLELFFFPPAKESKWCSEKSPELGIRGPEFQFWPWHFVAFGTLVRLLRPLWAYKMWRTISAGEQCWGGEEQALCNLAVAFQGETGPSKRSTWSGQKEEEAVISDWGVSEDMALMECGKAFVLLSQDTVFFLFLIMRAHQVVKDF